MVDRRRQRISSGGSGVDPGGSALSALSNQPIPEGIDFDSLISNIEDFQKLRQDKEDSDRAYNQRGIELDIMAKHYGIGTVQPNAQGKYQLIPNPPAPAQQQVIPPGVDPAIFNQL